MKLIANADDFGLSKALNLGVVESFNNGIVRSTTLLSNAPFFNHAIEIAKNNKNLGVGIHLTLTYGNALTGINKTITDAKGHFLGLSDFLNKVENEQIDLAEVEKEFRTQIRKVIDSGIKITHIDSHHHAHLKKGIFDITLKLANEYDFAIRAGKKEEPFKNNPNIKSSDWFTLAFYNTNISTENFLKILDKYKNTNDSVEIMVHPAYIDKALMQSTSYNLPRIEELAIMTDKKVWDYIQENKIELCSYACHSRGS